MVTLGGPPVGVVQRLAGNRGDPRGSLGHLGVAQPLRQRERALQRRDPDSGQVDILVDRGAQSSHFDRGQAPDRVLDDAVAVGLGAQAPLEGSPVCRPQFLEQPVIAARAPVLVERQHPVGSRVGVVVGVRIGLEPVDVRRALRDLVGDLAVVALIAGQEAEFLGDQLPLAEGVHGEGVHHRVAAEEPSESGAGPAAGEPPARDQAAPQVGVADALLLEVDLRPFEGQVERGIGGLDGRRCSQRRVRPGAGLPVEPLGVRDQAAVVSEHSVPRHRSRGDGDVDELAPGTLRIDRDDHRAGRLPELVRRVLHRVRRPGRADDRVVPLQALRENEDAPSPVPEGVLPAQRRGPHEVEDGMELGGDLDRVRAVDVEEHEDAGGVRVPGRQDVLAYPEGRVAVGDGGELRPHLDRPRDQLARDGGAVAGRRKAETEAASDLERVDPEFGVAGLHPQPRRARAGDSEVLARAHGAGELDGRCRDGEARDRKRGQVGGRGVGDALGVGWRGEEARERGEEEGGSGPARLRLDPPDAHCPHATLSTGC